MAGAAARVVERGGCCRLRDCPLSMAAYWRVLRTLGGKNIGKCRLRAHQHPLSPPLPNMRRARSHATSKARRVLGRLMERVLGDVLKMGCFVHRFLISGPDLRIDARFSRFTATCVHRFLISSPDLGIDARISPFTPSCVHRFLIDRKSVV